MPQKTSIVKEEKINMLTSYTCLTKMVQENCPLLLIINLDKGSQAQYWSYLIIIESCLRKEFCPLSLISLFPSEKDHRHHIKEKLSFNCLVIISSFLLVTQYHVYDYHLPSIFLARNCFFAFPKYLYTFLIIPIVQYPLFKLTFISQRIQIRQEHC